MVSAALLRKSFSAIASGLGVRRFRIAGLLYLVGAILSLFNIGFLIVFIAKIALAIAFISVPRKKVYPDKIPPRKIMSILFKSSKAGMLTHSLSFVRWMIM